MGYLPKNALYYHKIVLFRVPIVKIYLYNSILKFDNSCVYINIIKCVQVSTAHYNDLQWSAAINIKRIWYVVDIFYL